MDPYYHKQPDYGQSGYQPQNLPQDPGSPYNDPGNHNQPCYQPGNYGQPYYQQPPDDSSPGMATASLVLGICSLVLVMAGLSILLGALGLLLALLSRGSGRLERRSLAGFVTSLVGLCLGFLLIIGMVFLWGTLLNSPYFTRLQQEMEYYLDDYRYDDSYDYDYSDYYDYYDYYDYNDSYAYNDFYDYNYEGDYGYRNSQKNEEKLVEDSTL